MSNTPARKPVTPSHERPAWFAPGLLRKDVEELFQNFFSGVPAIWNDTGNLPSIDVSETDALVEVSTDLPGMKAEDLQIDVRDNVVTISGSTSEEKDVSTDSGRKYHRIERRKGSFSRSVSLPCEVDPNSGDAVLKDGVLHLTLKKTKAAKTQRISVRS